MLVGVGARIGYGEHIRKLRVVAKWSPSGKGGVTIRLEIFHDRRDQRSCKTFVTCVHFSKKQRSFLNIFQVYTQINVNFPHKC